MYPMHRVLCATPWEMEAERILFDEIVGQFNASAAILKGVLFVPVSLANIRDKRPLQYTVDENIRACRYYILVLGADWGPLERNFRPDYRLALACASDAALPMQDVVVLLKRQPPESPPADDLPEPRMTFETPEEFAGCLNTLLTGWLESIAV
jgi:hypothetical protein